MISIRTAATRLAPAVAYLATIVVANWLTAWYGLVPVGFGLAATAGTYVAGAAFVTRDWLQDTAGRAWVLAAIAAGGLLSAWLATPQLAVASAVAFALSEAADMAAYTPLRRRGYVRAAVVSNVTGAAVDTLLFLRLAGFPTTWPGFGGQMVGKFWITAATVLVVLAVRKRRGVLREPVHAEGA